MLLIHIDFGENRDNQFDFPLTECISKLFTALFNGSLGDPSCFPVSHTQFRTTTEHC